MAHRVCECGTCSGLSSTQPLPTNSHDKPIHVICSRCQSSCKSSGFDASFWFCATPFLLGLIHQHLVTPYESSVDLPPFPVIRSILSTPYRVLSITFAVSVNLRPHKFPTWWVESPPSSVRCAMYEAQWARQNDCPRGDQIVSSAPTASSLKRQSRMVECSREFPKQTWISFHRNLSSCRSVNSASQGKLPRPVLMWMLQFDITCHHFQTCTPSTHQPRMKLVVLWRRRPRLAVWLQKLFHTN